MSRIEEFEPVVKRLHDHLRRRDESLAVAESCTGGLLGGAITGVPGSSDVFEGGILAYSNRMKREQLGVSGGTLKSQGAVSELTAREMVQGLRRKLAVDVGVAVTGIAGPTGGTDEKPVGLVYTGIAHGQGIRICRSVFEGDRSEVRLRTVESALNLLNETLRPN